jgi:Arc/MetJ-type ribon-helix-helix transcriptional regulator
MSNELSPHIEQRITEALASGLYPSREALIEAGVESLLDERIPMVPDEDMPLVEAAFESSSVGRSAEMTRQEWNELHQMVNDIAAGRKVPRE